MRKLITYRDYKTFDESNFKFELKSSLTKGCATYGEFEDIFLKVLQKHAPLKKKLIRANHAPYMTKALRTSMMRRSQLETKYYKSKSPDDKKAYKKQKNFVSRLCKKKMKCFYQNLDLNNFLDNKKFWKNIKPFFSEKGPRKKKISLVVGEKIISEDNEVSESFHTFFRDAVQQLDIQENLHLLNKSNNTDNLIEYAIEKFESHPSILKIKEKVNSPIFNFRNVSLVDIEKEVKSLNPKKASNSLKQHFDIYGPTLQ